MIKIGRFSKLSLVSVRMLRHFDKLDLLKPTYVDEESGYRYYDESQLIKVSNIILLQKMGFSLSDIKIILDKNTTKEEIKNYLIKYKNDKEEELNKVKEQLALIDKNILRLSRSENIMKYNIERKIIPAYKIAYIRDIIPTFADEGMLWGRLMKGLYSNYPNAVDPQFNMAIYHDKEYKDTNVDVEVGVSIKDSVKEVGEIKVKDMPKMNVLSIIFNGSYEQIGDINIEAVEYAKKNDLEFIGPMFSIYHKGPKEVKSVEEQVTECCYPVK
ncbi:MerR family transcriptional regulator [Anaerofustis stercorihominis]|uniref:MerR family transcriptional regulator n=1 Tax=Anaerofustis stercorihominis TaxID=214853 RepID=A0A3E3DZ24_9FIRM|nr:MerR family transcriptional regulator [Anaerofustis stercorihominis]RGD74530.1 MerR family transcriptional regulator [Anaerofustis stercorihominis]